jgi:hypothetical protein
MDFLYAFASLSLGVVTSLHPCLALLNLGAYSIICGPMVQPVRMIIGGSLFIVGRIAGYIGIALLFMAGAIFSPQSAQLLRYYGNTLMGPLFIIIGMIISGMLGSSKSAKAFIQIRSRTGILQNLSLIFLGIIHAISFCPVSAGFFFGILMPLSSENNSLIANISFYGLGTGLPLLVIIFLTASGKKFLYGHSENRERIEFWIRTLSGAVVIVIGIYLTLDRVFNIIS